MLIARNRATKEDFRLINKAKIPKKNLHGRFFLLQLTEFPKEGTPFQRFAVIVSKKVSKLSVERHLVKRQTTNILRELLKDIRDEKYLTANIIGMLLVKNSIKNMKFAEIKKDLEELVLKMLTAILP